MRIRSNSDSFFRRFLGLPLAGAVFVALVTPAAVAEQAAAIAAASAPASAKTVAVAPDSEPAAQTSGASPTPPVEAFHAGLLGLMKEAETIGFQGRVDRLVPLMGETFDLEFMASKTVGAHWRKLSKEDRARWIESFTRLTTANYAGRFTGYTGERFETLGVEEAGRGTKLVRTKIIVPKGEDVTLNYRLLQKDGRWRVIDVYLNGTVSELALRRSEYSTALKREGFEQLLSTIETKIADLEAKGGNDG